MLYIGNTSKSAEDRSTRSVVDVYKTRYAQLDMKISNLRDILLNERDLVEKLQDRLKEDKQRLQDALDEERKDFNNSGINKNSELDELQRILDESDKELDDIGRGIDTGITCLSSCQTCFDVTYSSCNNECQSTVQQTCPSTYSSCNECQSTVQQTCIAVHCADEYSSCTTEAQTCSSCYIVSNNPSPCSYSSCDACVSGYTVTVCTSGNTSTVCTSCVTCQACDGTSNECTSTTQTGCWSTEQLGCSSCIEVAYDNNNIYSCQDEFKCIIVQYSGCIIGNTAYCIEVHKQCTILFPGGNIVDCSREYSIGDTTCTSLYSVCEDSHGDLDGIIQCVSGYKSPQTNCPTLYVEIADSTGTCLENYTYRDVLGCIDFYQTTEDSVNCQNGYHSVGTRCNGSYEDCANNFDTICTGGFSVVEETVCNPCFNVNAGCTSECYSCDGGSQTEICTSGNTTTTCTSCDEGLADCPSCYTTTYTECESCVSGNHNAQTLIDICTDAYDACGTTFANCYNTSSCTNGFAEAAGCEAGEGCGACQTACQSCDTCQAVCESTTQGCTGGVGCNSCYSSCNTAAQSCTTCYEAVYECHGTAYGGCSGCVSCLAAYCACGHSTNY